MNRTYYAAYTMSFRHCRTFLVTSVKCHACAKTEQQVISVPWETNIVLPRDQF